MQKVELLAPAGNFSKLKTAFYYGADAVYLGGKNFSLRSYADNFTEQEIAEAASYAHSLGKKVYVTVNIYAKNDDFALLEDYVKALSSARVDGVIVSDAGIVALTRRVAPELEIHLSTQANTTNKEAALFWQGQGVKRIVLARELSLEEAKQIHDYCPGLELEAFVHGAMCISYSGRCLLSNFLTGRNSNRGECVQACRWEYELRKKEKENYGSEFYPVEEDERGTYILNSKDLNMSEHLALLADAGVYSFKIEGRMKSEYYLATVINAYRRCIDLAYAGKKPTAELRDELKNAAHRDYTTAFAFGENDETVNYTDSQTKGGCDYIANVLGYEGDFVLLEMRNRFKKGDVLEVLSPSDNFGRSFTLNEMYDENGEACEDAKRVLSVYKAACPYKLVEGDIVRRRSL